MPSLQECESVAERALRWVIQHADSFLPQRDELAFHPTRAKPLIELAIMVHCHAGVTREPDVLEPLVQLLRSIRDVPEFRDRRFSSRSDIVIDAFLYAVLGRLGHDDVRHRERVQRAVDAGILESAERPPHQIMEERLSLDLGSFNHSLPAWSDLLERSIVGASPPPVHLGELAVYHVTHVILYLSAFGTRAAPVEVGGERLSRLLTTLLVTSCADEHWDLVGELLLCCDGIALGPSLIRERAWDAFLSQQAADGSFPGPRPKREQQEASEPPAQQRRFAERYHTTLVAVMAVAGHLRAEGRPALPLPRPSRPANAGPAPAVLARADALWLRGLLDRLSHEQRARSTDACNVLVGNWACTALDAAPTSRLAKVASRVATQLEPVRAWTGVSPALSLVVFGLLRAHGLAVPALSAFVHAVTAALRASPAADAASDVALCEKRVLLHGLGLAAPPDLLASADMVRMAGAVALTDSRSEIEQLLLSVESSTGYGTRPVALERTDAWVGELLSALAVRFLRSYDLPTATRLMRSAHHLGVTDHVDFLVSQHRPEGGFGFFGAQEATVKATVGDGFDTDRDLHLPLTVSCIHTLAELTTQWRLYGGLPRLTSR